jgi:hypothetical protein
MDVPSPPAGFAWKLNWFAAVVGPLYAVYQITNRWQIHPACPLPLTWIDSHLPLLAWTVWLLIAALRRRTKARPETTKDARV